MPEFRLSGLGHPNEVQRSGTINWPPLDQAMIKQLVLEAEILGMRIGELLDRSFSRS
jgi:hypothetical protein